MTEVLRAQVSDEQVQEIIDGIPTAAGDVEKWCVVSLWQRVWPGWPESMPMRLTAATVDASVRQRVRDALAAHVEGRQDADRLLYVFDGTAPKPHEEVPDEPDETVVAVN